MMGAIQAAFTKNLYADTINTVRDDMAKHTVKQARSMHYADVASMRKAGVFSDYVGITQKLDMVDALEVSNTGVARRLAAQASAVKSLRGIAVSFKAELMQYNIATARVGVKDAALSALRQVAMLLNQQGADGYEFGGASNNVPPIADVDNFVNQKNIVASKATRNYTNLVSSDVVSQIDLNRTIEARIDAANPAFQKIIAGFHMAASLENPDGVPDVAAMLDEGIKALERLTIDIAFKDKILDDANNSLSESKISISEELEVKFKPQIPDLVAEAEYHKQRLMFAMSALANDSKKPTLFDFLK